MRMDPRPVVAAPIAFAIALAGGCETTMSERITKSIGTLADVQASPEPVDAEIFRNARGIALVDERQIGVVISGAGGEGLLMRRTTTGWSAPCIIKVQGFSVGASIGGEGRNLVIVFSTDESIDKFVADGSYFMAQAQGVFGDSYGRTSDPAQKEDQVHVYAVAGGVYGSCALGSIGFHIDADANAAAYGAEHTAWDILDGKVPTPAGHSALVTRIDRITGGRTSGTAAVRTSQPANEQPVGGRSAARVRTEE
jgi:lipid-binding SYLF domain-containing protein